MEVTKSTIFKNIKIFTPVVYEDDRGYFIESFNQKIPLYSDNLSMLPSWNLMLESRRSGDAPGSGKDVDDDDGKEGLCKQLTWESWDAIWDGCILSR